MGRMMLLGLLLLLTASQAFGVAIGVNRATVEFNDVLRGGFAREEIVVTTDSLEPVTGEVLIRSGDESRHWLNFSARNFTFSRDRPYRLYVDVQPPEDARIETYRVEMSIMTGELSFRQEGQLGTATRASLGVDILTRMTGTERRACRVGGARVLDAERGQPVEVQFSILNTGNVRLSPDATVEVYDKFRSTKISEATEPLSAIILPTLSHDGRLLYEFDLARDQYWATVRVPDCGYSGVFTFDVLDAGEIKDDGEFIRIDAQSWAKAGDIIPIYAVFRNRGVRSLRANFRGTITNTGTGQIVKVINTQQYIVDPDVTAEMETFFNPVEPGRYMVTGKVFYNDKLTTERNFVLNVTGSALSFGNPVLRYSLYALLFVAVFLVVLIVRKKRRR